MMSRRYLSLIRNEVKWWRRPGRKQQELDKWWVISFVVGLLIAISFLTYIALQGTLDPRFLWTFSIGFPFVAFGMTYNVVNREWEGGTIGWWLSLPFPPTKLITAKLWAGLLQTGIIYLITFVVCIILGGYFLLLQNSFSLMNLLELVQLGLIWLVIILCVSPFIAAFGILNAVLAKSRLKLLLILLWGLFWVLPNLSFWAFSVDRLQGSPFPYLLSPDFLWDLPSFYLLIGIIAIGVFWFFAYLMIKSAAWVIKHDLSL